MANISLQKIEYMSDRTLSFLAFTTAFLIRAAFTCFYSLSSFDFFPTDSHEYVALADRALAGNFDFGVQRFIRSPLYPIFISLHKLLFTNQWQNTLVFSQLMLSSLTGVLLCRITRRLFALPGVSLCVVILYAVYLPVFYYVYSFTSETLYLFFNVSTFYCLVVLLQNQSLKNLIFFSTGFSLAYLTRSEILLSLPFILILICYTTYPNVKKSLTVSASIVLVILLITLPWGLTNKKINDSYIMSSNGGLYVFYLSNSEIGFADIVKTPHPNTREYEALMSDYSFFDASFDSIMALPQGDKQAAFLRRSLNWIADNPSKFIKVKFWNMVNFVSPGLTIGRHQSFEWRLMFLFCLPFHVLYYVGFIISIRKTSLKNNLVYLSFWLGTLAFLLLFLYTARFRAYSIEVYYLIYGGFAIWTFVQKLMKRADFNKPNNLWQSN